MMTVDEVRRARGHMNGRLLGSLIGYIDPLLVCIDEQDAEIQRLTKVITWVALNTFDGICGVSRDRYEYATKVANENGREEATEADEVEGFIRMVSHAIERGKV